MWEITIQGFYFFHKESEVLKLNIKNKCSYCDKEITEFVETSRLNKNIKLCTNCYYGEMFSIVMSKIIKESEDIKKWII